VAIALSRLVRRNVNGTAGQSGKKSVHLLDVHSILAAEGFENTAQAFEFSIASKARSSFHNPIAFGVGDAASERKRQSMEAETISRFFAIPTEGHFKRMSRCDDRKSRHLCRPSARH